MNPDKHVTPLDKEALVLLPGLRYAQAMIDIAIQVARNSALREHLKPASRDPGSPTQT
jgi:hypothetical protein